jgi:flagellar hook assembly protein FlgD
LVSIGYYLPSSANVELATFSAAGRRIRQLVRTSQPAGVHSVSWDGLDDHGHRVGAGVYFYKLRVAGKAVGSRRVVIVP